MDSEITRDQWLGVNSYYFVGVCGSTLRYNATKTDNLSHWENCYNRRTKIYTDPGSQPECTECLTTVCSLLKKKLKHGL
jgi:hypothetical protein